MNSEQRAEYKRLEERKRENRDIIKRKNSAKDKIKKEIRELERSNELITDKQMALLNQKLF